jgi:deazaflavin-dependent oxidoreductase (nitroreductase family)
MAGPPSGGRSGPGAVRGLRHVDPYRRRGRFYLAWCRISASRGVGPLAKLGWRLDPFLLRVTRGRLSTATPLAAGLLETTGARTGRRRRNATLYFHDGDCVTIVASLRGAPRHPAWFHNLCNNADVVYNGLPFRAQVVEDPDERARLWELADRVYPPYAAFREQAARAGREIPIVQLLPRPQPVRLGLPSASRETQQRQVNPG